MAVSTITCSLADAPALFRKLGNRTRSALMLGARSAALQMVPIMVRQTDKAPPASQRGSRGAVNTGEYRRRWKATALTGASGNVGVLVGNSAPYAGIIEYGRRKGAKRPPTEPIARWAQRKFGIPYQAAKGIAFVIARRISQRGLLARHVLTGRQTEQLLLEALERDVLHELIRALRTP